MGTLARIFPIRPDDRDYPYEPMIHGETGRDAPLPFVEGVGATSVIETTYEINPLLQVYTSAYDPSQPPGGGGTGTGGADCNPITNQWCVPRATISKSSNPIATITCTIT